MLAYAHEHCRSCVVKPSRTKGKIDHQSKAPQEDVDQAAGTAPEAPLTPEERARLLVKLEAELEAAERSIEDEGTISAEELLKQRAAYWAGVTRGSGQGGRKPPRRQRR
jgi:acyl-CoA reductase-like NAD-dependent aldehyde dehydrogenase